MGETEAREQEAGLFRLWEACGHDPRDLRTRGSGSAGIRVSALGENLTNRFFYWDSVNAPPGNQDGMRESEIATSSMLAGR